MLLLFCVLEFLKTFWGVTAGEHCRDGLPAFFMFFCANAQSFWGVAAGEHCRDGLPAFFMFFCANAQSFRGVAAGEHFMFFLRECAVFLGCCSWRTLQRWTACLFLCAFGANAQSFWGVAAIDCLHFAFYNSAGMSTATFNEFFLAGTLTAH